MKDTLQILINKFGTRIQLNKSLAPYTTFKIGGKADYLLETKTEEEIIFVIQEVEKLGLEYVVLGGGSNVLISDKGFRGLVIVIKNSLLDVCKQGQEFRVKVGAGVALSKLVAKVQEVTATGLEFAAGIPGTVGGAIRDNAGAWQQDIGERIVSVTTVNDNGQILIYPKKDCGFGYRRSIFKDRKDKKEVILKAELVFPLGEKLKIDTLIKENLLKRSTQPREPSAGCIFINPKNQAAGLLIDKCGLKGFKIGDAQVSDKHANFIINLGNAKAQEVAALIALIKQRVREKFALDLEEEIVRIGEF